MDQSAARLSACAVCLLRMAHQSASRHGIRGEDADDSAGDFALRMWRGSGWGLPTQEGCAKCIALARVCAQRNTLEHVRALRRRLIHECPQTTNGQDPAEAAPLSDALSPEMALLRTELTRVVDQAMQRLNSRHRSLLLRHYICGETAREIAEDLGIKPGAVEQCLHRARSSLRRALEDAGWHGTEALACLSPFRQSAD